MKTLNYLTAHTKVSRSFSLMEYLCKGYELYTPQSEPVYYSQQVQEMILCRYVSRKIWIHSIFAGLVLQLLYFICPKSCTSCGRIRVCQADIEVFRIRLNTSANQKYLKSKPYRCTRDNVWIPTKILFISYWKVSLKMTKSSSSKEDKSDQSSPETGVKR